jgi:hypothetical protein
MKQLFTWTKGLRYELRLSSQLYYFFLQKDSKTELSRLCENEERVFTQPLNERKTFLNPVGVTQLINGVTPTGFK